jgi:uncharacterized protein (TIGR03435 family)
MTLRLSVAFALFAAGAHAQEPPPPVVIPAFEAVVLKRNTSGSQSMSAGNQPGGIHRVVNGPISTIFGNAYRSQSGEVKGAPDWFTTERYDLTARIVGNPTREEEQALWRKLFAERMKLRAHHETEERPTYALILARRDGRLGPGLKKAAIDCSTRAEASRRGDTLPPPPQASNGLPACSSRFSENVMMTGGQTMARLASSLSSLAGRMVVDQTGLSGDYEFTLEYSRLGDVGDRPNIFTALQEQLGLKLEPARHPVEFVVIDQIERPTTD